ncbi:MAG: hypothetical protein GX639_01455 [Fibrobacter sp.]|nr:hypothetical protein [Fibrobacter sp.]
MSQITLRDIPDELETYIRTLSQQKGLSLNKTVLDLLKKSTGMLQEKKKLRDLSSLAGTWNDTDVKEFEKNTAIFDTIDSEIWKK